MSLIHLRQLVLIAAIGLALASYLRIPKPRTRMLRAAGLLTGMALALEVSAFALALPKLNNTGLYNIFLPLEFLLVLAIVHSLRLVSGRFILISMVIGLAGLVANMLLIDPRQSMLFEAGVIFAVLLAALLFTSLWALANGSAIALQRIPAFWLLLGLFVYFAGLVPLVGLGRFLGERDPALASTLWTIMPVLATTRYLLAAYAFRLQRRGPADAV